MLKVVSLDDHPIFGFGLKESLTAYDASIEVIALTDTQDALTYLTKNHDVDLLILDLHMPKIDGMTFIRSLHANKVVVPIAIMSALEDLHIYQEALSIGVMGIIPKTFSPKDIAKAIHKIVDGEMSIPDDIARQLSLMTKYSKDNTDTILSKRQLEILRMVQAGLSNSGIASVLFISELTVKSHLRAIFRILGVNNRVACVRKAEKMDII